MRLLLMCPLLLRLLLLRLPSCVFFFSLSQYAAPVPASLMSTAPVSACFSADLTNLLPLYLQLE